MRPCKTASSGSDRPKAALCRIPLCVWARHKAVRPPLHQLSPAGCCKRSLLGVQHLPPGSHQQVRLKACLSTLHASGSTSTRIFVDSRTGCAHLHRGVERAARLHASSAAALCDYTCGRSPTLRAAAIASTSNGMNRAAHHHAHVHERDLAQCGNGAVLRTDRRRVIRVHNHWQPFPQSLPNGRISLLITAAYGLQLG